MFVGSIVSHGRWRSRSVGKTEIRVWTRGAEDGSGCAKRDKDKTTKKKKVAGRSVEVRIKFLCCLVGTTMY